MDYWKKRTLANEEKASRLAASYAKRQRQALEKAYKQIENYLNALYVQINYGGADKITRTQLWQYSKYLELEQQIRKELNNVAIQQIEDIKEVTQRVFEETLETDLEELLGTSKHYSINSESLMKQNLNSAWSGLDYSKRVWINTNELAERLKNDINDMIVLGKSPNQIKEALMWDFNTAYDVADRLVRTEASYAFNSANMASYKAAGLQYIKLLPERDEKLCSRCRELANENGGIYEINEAPTLPVHPRCRCCYSPVVNLKENIGSLDIDIDEFVPCLKNTKTGEIVDTIVETVDKKQLKEYNIKNGWYINWSKVPNDVQVHALKIKGSDRIEGLIGLRNDNDAQAMYIHWAVAAPHNNKLQGVIGEKEYTGVGGHLFAVAAEESIKNGYGGCFYGIAANEKLAEYYCTKTGAIYIPVMNQRRVVWDEYTANNILKEYNYERQGN